jgi:hypothetical protein
MVDGNPPRNMMVEILAARYAPLVLPQPMNSLPSRDYLKYMPQFIGEGDVTTKEHLSSFYRFAEIHAIENEDVWMRVFVRRLDGDDRYWFKELSPRSVDEIDALDDLYLRHWRNKKYLLYYATKFGALKREEGEVVLDFSKRFNKMYKKIPTEVNPTETSTKMTYASAFDPDFYLPLRERRATSLAHMQDASLEVESNILAVDKIRSKADRDRRKGRSEALPYSPFDSPPQMDEVTKLLKSLSTRMERLELEGKKSYRNFQILIIGVVSKDQTMPLRSSKETKETGTEMIREFMILSKITLLLMKKERKKSLILKYIVLETPPHFLI